MKSLMTILALVIAVSIAGLAGCSVSYQEPVLSIDHPAHPMAATASKVETPKTLDLAAAESVRRIEPAPTIPDPSRSAGEKSSDVFYACPMHPEVTSTLPDQRCPKCGMKLKLAEPDSAGGGQ